MKSKISFFNKTIFMKNVTLYWPIWVIYTLFLLAALPIQLWLSYNDGFRLTPLTDEQKLSYLLYAIEPGYYIWVIAIAAVITGMAIYHYLYNARSANMIHSLPVDRTQLFGTNIISGLTFLIVPQIVSFILAVLICLNEGNTRVEYLGIWLLIMMATAVIAFSIVTFCAFFTGHFVAMPLYVLIVNGLVFAFGGVVELMVSAFGYGVNTSSLISADVLEWFSPLVCYLNNVDISRIYNVYDQLEGAAINGIPCIIIYLIVAVVLYVVAYLVYQKRHIEQAGELITVSWVKPIFRWGVGTLGAFFGSIIIQAVLLDIGLEMNLFVFIILLLIIGMIFYFVADMFVRKTFRVFKKKNWIGCGIFSIILLASFGGLYFYAELEEKRIPEAEDVKYAYVEMGYTSTYEEEESDTVIEIHQMILDNIEHFQSLDESDYYFHEQYNYVGYDYVYISYVLNDGSIYRRDYRIPYDEQGKAILERIAEIEQDPENFLRNTIGDNYEDIVEVTGGRVDMIVYEKDENGEVYENWDEIDILYGNAKLLFDAIIADAKAGNLVKYNSHYYDYQWENTDEEYKYYESNGMINLKYVIPNGGKTLPDYWDYYYYGNNAVSEEEYYGDTGSIYVSFGKDCENIIKTLIQIGAIESTEDVVWAD